MKKIIVELDDNIYQDLFNEWKKLQNSNIVGLNCSTFENFTAAILKSFISTNKLTENLKNGNFTNLLDQLKELVPGGDLSSIFNLSKNESNSKNSDNEGNKNNEKYKS